MKKNFIDLSGKIDTHRLDAIEAISKVATSLIIPSNGTYNWHS